MRQTRGALVRSPRICGASGTAPRSSKAFQKPGIPPDRLEAELFVQPLRPVVSVGDEEGQLVVRRVRLGNGVQHERPGQAPAAVVRQREDVLDLADAVL